MDIYNYIIDIYVIYEYIIYREFDKSATALFEFAVIFTLEEEIRLF